MRLNKYLFNRVNNKERERGQRSVVWLKRGQPCLHRLHVLSTVFSRRPFSSFSLSIILLPSILAVVCCCGQTVFFLRCFWLRLVFVQSLFIRNLGDNVGGTFVPAFGHGFCLDVFCLILHGWKFRQQLGYGVFAK